jgi:hypothetical protein
VIVEDLVFARGAHYVAQDALFIRHPEGPHCLVYQRKAYESGLDRDRKSVQNAGQEKRKASRLPTRSPKSSDISPTRRERVADVGEEYSTAAQTTQGTHR